MFTSGRSKWLLGALCASAVVLAGGCGNGNGEEEEQLTPEQAYQDSLERAEQGDPDGLFDLAYAYSRGLGTEQDMEKAYEVLREAAEAGNGRAQLILSELYLQINRDHEHEGMIKIKRDWYTVRSRDRREGLKWLFRAELNEDERISRPAEGILVTLIREMDEFDRSMVLELAKEYGHPEWQEVLGQR
ncbi:hypothetical protein CKO15_10665 [Halorhodospira abdelmalekii]|uniref:tetratricopeptide repeat protein n=1 Tax=Halorhodospira abdelmalekii TaxID=421629 RepID=UPI00190649C4|nr:sel1 repeat family protein [Halorhodospira abdelmalekii]MBK1735734.1 hypothetical protein [Halorhodospira abdelmalekii]